jgi:uncharacterized membrane protein
MIIGEHNREVDINVNQTKEKKLTNMRASGKDEAVILSPIKQMTIERAINFIRADEMVEITLFTALTLIPAGLVAILLYLYPIMVMILSVLFFKEKVSAGKLLALILALSGTVLVIGLQIGGSPVGIAWGLGAAMIYSLYIVTGATVLRGTEPLTASMVIMAGAAFSLALMTFVQGIHLPRTAPGWIWVICIGVLCTAIAISLFFGGMKVIGAVDASLGFHFRAGNHRGPGVCLVGRRYWSASARGHGTDPGRGDAARPAAIRWPP